MVCYPLNVVSSPYIHCTWKHYQIWWLSKKGHQLVVFAEKEVVGTVGGEKMVAIADEGVEGTVGGEKAVTC